MRDELDALLGAGIGALDATGNDDLARELERLTPLLLDQLDQLDQLEAVAEAAREWNEHYTNLGQDSDTTDTALGRLHAALAALPSPAVAHRGEAHG